MSSAGAVTFNYAAWIARYPEFTAVTQPTAQMYFDEATLYCANVVGLVKTTAQLSVFLNMVTAHIAALAARVAAAGNNPSAPPGRISSATEGSVTANFEVVGVPGSKDWFDQTIYGQAFWQATLRYRLSQYVVGPGGRVPRRGRLC